MGGGVILGRTNSHHCPTAPRLTRGGKGKKVCWALVGRSWASATWRKAPSGGCTAQLGGTSEARPLLQPPQLPGQPHCKLEVKLANRPSLLHPGGGVKCSSRHRDDYNKLSTANLKVLSLGTLGPPPGWRLPQWRSLGVLEDTCHRTAETL